MTDVLNKTRQGYTHHFAPDSEVIDEVFWDRDTQTLFVFLHNGSKAGYSGVPVEVYEDFALASSAGRYWNNNIKRKSGRFGQYRGISSDVELFERVSLSDKVLGATIVNKGFHDPQPTTIANASQANDIISSYNYENTVASPGPKPNRVWRIVVEVEAVDYAQAVSRAGINVEAAIVGVERV